MAVFDAGIWDLGNPHNACPNCGAELARRPGRKARCPHCGSFIYVRTRPLDRQRVLLTESDAETVQRQWGLLGMALRVPEGTESADLIQQLAEHAARSKWGLYRNAKLYLSGLAESEFRWRDAFRGYLEVCYIDLNGPNNGGPVGFEPSTARLAPALVDKLNYFTHWFDLCERRVRDEYIEVATGLDRELQLPISPDESWRRLAVALDCVPATDGGRNDVTATQGWWRGRRGGRE